MGGYNFLRTVVRNDAIALDPPEVYNWRVFALAAAACFGGTLFGMDTGIIGGVLTMPDFKAEFGLNGLSKTDAANLSANLVTTMQAGAFAGALLANPLAGKLGRKPGLLIVALFAFIGGILQAFSYGNFACFYVGRFVEGLGLGGATMMAPTYVAENSPRGIRGLLIGFYQLFETMGAMVAFFIDYGALLNISGHGAWMVPLAMQSLPPVLIFVSILFCPESPRWLASKDNWDKASEVLSQVRHLPVEHPYVQQELLELRTQLEEERRSVHGTGFWATQKECWLVPGNRKRALMSIGLMVCQQWTGTNAINYYAPTIFTALGITGNANSLLATGVYGIVKMVSCGLFITFLADTLGRRWSFVWTGFAMSFCMFYLGFYVRFDPPVDGAAIPAAGYVALVMVYLFAAAFQFGWGPVCWIYVSEIPTNRLRGYNVSLAAATQWLFNLVVARVSPVMLVSAGAHGYGTYFIYACFCFAMAVIAYWVPETKGISLERMDELFGTADFSGLEDVGKAAKQVHDEEEKGVTENRERL
ncbi:putative MFS quinate transporter [Diplogelasinospora grovesii]|uniref:MFS quinate transporter n=1 Tax=Diplogelasinospora grovesii TaxID=303347 RepID=A0AAN6S0I3_9PEZI|nr:putative MFS quinate transporter [Diplogelasinospora grovesii]